MKKESAYLSFTLRLTDASDSKFQTILLCSSTLTRDSLSEVLGRGTWLPLGVRNLPETEARLCASSVARVLRELMMVASRFVWRVLSEDLVLAAKSGK